MTNKPAKIIARGHGYSVIRTEQGIIQVRQGKNVLHSTPTQGIKEAVALCLEELCKSGVLTQEIQEQFEQVVRMMSE